LLHFLFFSFLFFPFPYPPSPLSSFSLSSKLFPLVITYVSEVAQHRKKSRFAPAFSDGALGGGGSFGLLCQLNRSAKKKIMTKRKSGSAKNAEIPSLIHALAVRRTQLE
jgi:hypothetical protein